MNTELNESVESVESTEIMETSNPLISKSKEIEIKSKFQEYADIANEWREKAFAIVVTDETQVELVEQAKIAKKFLQSKRIELEKTRKKLKEQSLEEGRMIDRIAKDLTKIIEPAEDHLELQSKFIEIQIQNKRLQLESSRLEKLKPYLEFVDLDAFDLKTMSDVAFETIFNGAMFAHDQKMKREEQERLRLEQERIEREELEKKSAILNQRQEKLKSIWFFYKEGVDAVLDINTSEKEFEDLFNLLSERKSQAEQDRIKAEQEIKKLEEQRKREEQERIKAEQERIKAENDRIKAEQDRIKAEQEIKNLEEQRKREEQERIKAEQERTEKELQLEKQREQERQIAEQNRIKAEKEADELRNQIDLQKQKSASATSSSGETKLPYEVLLRQNQAMKKALEDVNKFIIPDNARKIITDILKEVKTF
jgi:trichohyalin